MFEELRQVVAKAFVWGGDALAKANEAPLPFTVSFKPRSRAEYLATEEGHIRNKLMMDDLYRRIVPEDVRNERERIQETIRAGRLRNAAKG